MRFLELPKAEFAGGELRYIFDTSACYVPEFRQAEQGFEVRLTAAPMPRRHVDYITRIYDPRLTDARVVTLLDNAGERVGYAELAMEHDGQVARITNLLVEDEYRRRGYGSLLVSRARTMAKSAGAISLRVYVSGINAGAVRFLQLQGMTLVGFSALEDELMLELGMKV